MNGSDSGTFDPIVLEICWNRLIAVANEQAAALKRTAFSSVVREAGDLSAGVFDRLGRMIAQAVTGTPGHINCMALAVRNILEVYPVETIGRGDVFITNDAWLNSGHLHDVTICLPVFRGDVVVAFFASTCHVTDIGGRLLSAAANEVFEEGLCIPIMKYYDAGKRDETLVKMIRSNTRVPDQVLGDCEAQVAGAKVGGQRLLEFMDEFGLDRLEPLAEEIFDRTEQALRTAICKIPEGVYEYSCQNDGFESPVTIKVRCERRGDDLHIDYAGSSGASPRGINVVFPYTLAYTTYGIKVLIDPEVPNNHGTFRPLKISAPEGSILNARRPVAVAARHLVGHCLPHALAGALAPTRPAGLMAEGAAGIWGIQLSGRQSGGAPFTYYFLTSGGTGARSTKDGLSATAFPSGVLGTPVEVIEAVSPLVIESRSLRPGSGGDGQYRGGLGQSFTFRVRTDSPYRCSMLCDRLVTPANGLLGGKPGAKGGVLVDGSVVENPRVPHTIPPGARIEVVLPGGGGLGRPEARDEAARATDLLQGYVLESGAAQFGE